MESDKIETKIEVDDYDFEEKVIEQSKQIPVIVDFWAQWCMPCLMLGPVLEKLTNEEKGKFILAKLNVDKNPVTSQIYGIRSIPAVKIFKDGEVVTEFIGAIPESQVREYLKKI
jgi:putative thioredoxin